MNNDKLKKKIVDIVNEWHWFQKRDANGNTIWQANDTEKLADALIAAVIDDAKEYKHRAEVAERALEYACLDFATCYPSGTWNDFAVEYADRCRRQAERILKEERKDD